MNAIGVEPQVEHSPPHESRQLVHDWHPPPTAHRPSRKAIPARSLHRLLTSMCLYLVVVDRSTNMFAPIRFIGVPAKVV
jgi:hypothetical protein